MRWFLLFMAISVSAQAPDYLAGLPGLQETIKGEIAAGNISGVSIALVEGTRILYVDGFGLADKKRKIPVARDTVYRAGSISKLFTALSVMQLAEQEKLSIDRPLTDALPGFRAINPFPNAKPLTLRQLMCH